LRERGKGGKSKERKVRGRIVRKGRKGPLFPRIGEGRTEKGKRAQGTPSMGYGEKSRRKRLYRYVERGIRGSETRKSTQEAFEI